MGEFDRPEWTPSEGELRAELCNAREIDWPAEASKHFNDRHKSAITTLDEYDEYMEGLLKDGRNFPEIPLRYMESPADWINRPLEFILNQIQGSPEEYQGYITGMVNRYLTACFKRLGGEWPSDIWDGSGNPFFTVNCYTFCCPEWVGDDDLLRKIIVLQKLQTLISERVRQDDPAKSNEEQAGEPAAVDGAADQQEAKPIKWRGEQEQLRQLADQLQEQGHVESSQWFVERFDSDSPPDVDGWSGAANHIVYLLERLQDRKLFVHVPQSRIERVFRIKGYKSKKDGYGRNNAEKPKKADEIDRILSSVFPDS